MSNKTNKYVTPVGLQQPAAADLSDGTTGSGAVVLAGSPTLTGTPAIAAATATTPSTADNTTKVATTAYVQAQGYVTSATAPVTSVAGKTGAVTLVEGDIANLTSDLALKAPLASPALTGTPTAPTAGLGTNTTQLATTAFVLANAGGTTAVTQPVGNNSTLIANTAFYQQSYFRRMILHGTDGTTTTFQNIGEAAPTATGATIQARTVAQSGPGINATTNTGSQSIGFNSPSANIKTGKNITMFFIGWLNILTTERAWFGITDQTLSTMLGSDNPAGNYAAFRYSTIGSDTVWQCITKDGTTQAIASSGIAPTSNIQQSFMIVFNDSVPSVAFYIAGSLVATSTTHLPTTATAVNWMLGSFNTASGSFQNGVTLNQLIIQTDTP